MADFKVIVSGAGLGGLCLAQSLRRHGIGVEVFERDVTPWDRPQGYRLHIDSDGINALYHALTPELYQLFHATAMKAEPFTTIVDTDLNIVRRVPADTHGGSQANMEAGRPSHVNVSRVTLREILLTGLDDVVHFGREVVGYESDADGVAAPLADGQTVRADLLVGADGIRSPLRKQRVPQARLQDSGVRAIYARLSMDDAVKHVPEYARQDVFTVGIDDRKLYLGIGPVAFPSRPDVASAEIWPAAKLRPQEDYVVCIVGGRLELFGRPDAELHGLSGTALQTLALDLMQDWPEAARAIPEHADPDSFFFVEMHTSVPCEMPKSANVTLLGDAIHGMTPTLGRGANLAMRDAAMLGNRLADVATERQKLAKALGAYEDDMTSYGFDVVRKSVAMGVRLMGQNSLPPE